MEPIVKFALMHVCGPDPLRCDCALRTLHTTRAIEVRDVGKGLWDTARRAWLAASEKSTHAFVLQDDFSLAKDFVNQVRNRVSSFPNDCLSFFQPPSRRRRGLYIGEGLPGWRNDLGYVWGGTVALPSHLVQAFVIQADAMDFAWGDDERLSYFCRTNGIKVRHWYPSLLEHVGWDRSLIGGVADEWRRGTTKCP